MYCVQEGAVADEGWVEPAVDHGHPNVHTGARILYGVGRARTTFQRHADVSGTAVERTFTVAASATVNVRSTDVGALVHLTCPRLSFCISAAIVLADATTIFLAAPAMSHRHELQPSHLRLGTRPRAAVTPPTPEFLGRFRPSKGSRCVCVKS